MTKKEIIELGYKKYPEVIVINEVGFPEDQNEVPRRAYIEGFSDGINSK